MENFHTNTIRIEYPINNSNFPIELIEEKVNKFVSSKVEYLNIEVRDKINLLSCNRMTGHYNKEEKKVKDIKYNHVHSVSENS